MNMQNLMMQAKKMQSDMLKITKEIEDKEFETVKNGINVIINGKNEVIQVKIIDDNLLNDKEILEDLLMLALNETLQNIIEEKESKLGKYSSGIGGLF